MAGSGAGAKRDIGGKLGRSDDELRRNSVCRCEERLKLSVLRYVREHRPYIFVLELPTIIRRAGLAFGGLGGAATFVT